jgi:hypothetical protein
MPMLIILFLLLAGCTTQQDEWRNISDVVQRSKP